jgi:hypothetical protein
MPGSLNLFKPIIGCLEVVRVIVVVVVGGVIGEGRVEVAVRTGVVKMDLVPVLEVEDSKGVNTAEGEELAAAVRVVAGEEVVAEVR